MLNRTLQNLPFEVVSPSHYRLDPALTNGHTIDVSFLGVDPLPADTAPAEGWCLFLDYPDGSVSTRLFGSRDAAIGFLASVFRP